MRKIYFAIVFLLVTLNVYAVTVTVNPTRLDFGTVPQGTLRTAEFTITADPGGDQTFGNPANFAPFVLPSSAVHLPTATPVPVTVILPASALPGGHTALLKIAPGVEVTLAAFVSPAVPLDFGDVAQCTVKGPQQFVFHHTNIPILSSLTFKTKIDPPFTVSPSEASTSRDTTFDLRISTPAQAGPVSGVFKIFAPVTGLEVQRVFLQARVLSSPPDLTVAVSNSDIQIEDATGGGKKITVRILVNHTGGPSSACSGQVLFNGNVKATFPISAFTCGGNFSHAEGFDTNRTGANTIKVKVDTDGQNQESNENNNSTGDITVQL